MEQPRTILVADDEALARRRIVSFLAESELDLRIIEASTGKETIAALKQHRPDLVFLDIKMTDMSGFEVLQQVPSQEIPIVIFVTAFDVFAVKAFEVQAIDFLLKPYKRDRFYEALDRGLNQLERNSKLAFQDRVGKLMNLLGNHHESLEQGHSYWEQLTLKKRKKYYFVKTNQIDYIQSSGYYAEIFTRDKQKHVYRISMTELANNLNPGQFSRINRSTIVCHDRISEIVSEGMGDYSLVTDIGKTFSITKNYKADFLKKMGIR